MAMPTASRTCRKLAILPCVAALHHLNHMLYLGAASPVRPYQALEAEPQWLALGLQREGASSRSTRKFRSRLLNIAPAPYSLLTRARLSSIIIPTCT